MPDEIFVIFTDQTDMWWLKFLRRGFRHCFVLIRFADIWISVDGLANRTEIMRLDMPDLHNLLQCLESVGDRVLKITPPIIAKPKMVFPSPYSCVENVKRILGMNKPWILTPWQLYKNLTSEKEKTYGKFKLASKKRC